MLGAHSTGTGSFRFEDVRLEPDQLFVAPGTAFRAAMEAIDLARVVVSAMCAGMLRRGLETAVDYVSNRSAFGGPLSDQQGLRWMLADVATDLEAATALTQTATAAIDANASDKGVRAAHAKKFATRVALDGLSQCMQALGANGFRHDRPHRPATWPAPRWRTTSTAPPRSRTSSSPALSSTRSLARGHRSISFVVRRRRPPSRPTACDTPR